MFHPTQADSYLSPPTEPVDPGLDETVQHATEAVAANRDDIERLLLITEALWHIVKEKLSCEDDELVRRVLEIDARDGSVDGKVAPKPPPNCPNCDRPLMKHRRYCLYCGQPAPVDLFSR